MKKALWACWFLTLTLGCNDNPSPSPAPTGPGLGGSCATETCRKGLVCDAKQVCQGAGDVPDGAQCTLGVDCVSGYCAPNGSRGKCTPAGMLPKGAVCQGDGQCAKGLKCGFNGEGLFPVCLEGDQKDLGTSCTLNKECAQGLFCQMGKCASVPLDPKLAPNGQPPFLPATPGTGWNGPKCEAEKTSGISALWVLPRDTDGDEQKTDFFRLPFPNEAHRDANGVIDFSRLPKDPNPPFGFDALGRYLEVLKTEPFGNYPTVTLRFSGRVDYSTLSPMGSNRLRYLDLTAGTRFGSPRGYFYQAGSGGNRYLCHNWLSIRPNTSDVLAEGTYAVLLLKGVKDTAGGAVEPSADFVAMLQPNAPADAKQAAVWPKYQPLRDYLTQNSISPADVVTATVFTVGDPKRLMKKLNAAVNAAPVAKADAWVKCGGGSPSPCPDATGARACGSNPNFDEWHTLLEVPIYQQGTAPYLTPAMGGNIDLSPAPLMPVRQEKICVALTTPKGTPPAGGWPVVVYGHGTGGTYRGHAADGSGNALASVTLAGVTDPLKVAVLGFDAVGHGPRRGARTDVSPDDIVFNFANPASARGTMAQAATDLLSIAKYLKSTSAAPPAGLPLLDVSRLAYWGHSQGATSGALALAFDRSFEGALMTGASASLIDALTSKKAPVNIAGSLWIALGESGPAAVGPYHPVLSLFQTWSDVVDPIHFARENVVQPVDGATPAFARHLFQVWGKDDLFTARPVQTAYAAAARLAWVGLEVDEYSHATLQMSVQGNLTQPKPVTAVMKQYAPSGYDGHFVVFQNMEATRDAARFVGRVLRGEVPKVPEN